jgi:hypothetical protein
LDFETLGTNYSLILILVFEICEPMGITKIKDPSCTGKNSPDLCLGYSLRPWALLEYLGPSEMEPTTNLIPVKLTSESLY